jgi:hypothetical protein
VQFDVDALDLAPAQGQRRVADAYDEGITAGARLGEYLDLFPAHEAELEEPSLERGEGTRSRADAHDPPGCSGRKRSEAHKPRIKSESGGMGYGVHGCDYG